MFQFLLYVLYGSLFPFTKLSYINKNNTNDAFNWANHYVGAMKHQNATRA